MDLIDSLLHYVQEIKPYHTKIYGVDVEYRAFDDVHVQVTEELKTWTYIGVPFRNMDEYEWGVNGYPYNAGPNFPIPPYFEQLFDLQSGWDTIGFDASDGWDGSDKSTTHLQLADPKRGLLIDNVLVMFEEKLNIEFDRVTSDIDDVPYVIYQSWDPMFDGFDIKTVNSNSIEIAGDYSMVLGPDKANEIQLVDSEMNNGTYSVVQSIYNYERDTTTISLSFTLDTVDQTGKVIFGIWDSGIGWDGQVKYQGLSQPDADIYSQSQVAEQIKLMINHGWDDANLQGWDNTDTMFTWDDGETVLDHMSHKFDTPGWENNLQPWQAIPPDSILNTIDYTDGQRPEVEYVDHDYLIDPQGIYYRPNSTGRIAFSPTRLPVPYQLPTQQVATTPLNNSWTQLSSYPGSDNRTSGGLAGVGGKLYMYGGFGASQSDLWEYNIADDSWQQRASGAQTTHSHTMVTYNDKIYVFGGNYNSNQLHEYNPATNQWNQKSSCPLATSAHVAEVIGDAMYVHGGFAGEFDRHTMKYSFVDDSWEQVANGPANRFYAASCVVGHFMYMFGGASSNISPNPSHELWRYNTVTDVWQLETYAPTTRQQHIIACFGNEIHIIGGQDGAFNTTANILTYNLNTKQWNTIPGSFIEGWPQNSANTTYDNKVYLFGGGISAPGTVDDGKKLWMLE